MEIKNAITPKDRSSWRSWLKSNHGNKKEAWMILYKKHSGIRGITLAAAVEEALCYGWIDGTLKRIDGTRHAVRFTPRRRGSVWSDVNKDRVKMLLKARRMKAAGLESIKGIDLDLREIKLSRINLAMPRDLRLELAKDKKAREFFDGLAPSLRKQYLWWVKSAKKPETRALRIKKTAQGMEQGRKWVIYGG